MKLTINQVLGLVGEKVGAAPDSMAKGAALRYYRQLLQNIHALNIGNTVVVETTVKPTKEFDEALKEPSEQPEEKEAVQSTTKSRTRRRRSYRRLKEEESDRGKVEQSDALVVGGEQPGANAVGGVEIVVARQLEAVGR